MPGAGLPHGGATHGRGWVQAGKASPHPGPVRRPGRAAPALLGLFSAAPRPPPGRRGAAGPPVPPAAPGRREARAPPLPGPGCPAGGRNGRDSIGGVAQVPRGSSALPGKI